MSEERTLEQSVVMAVTLTDASNATWRLRFMAEEVDLDESSGEPDIEVLLTQADAVAIKDGRLSPAVAYMQGRLKPSGDMTLLLELLAWAEAHPRSSV